MSDESKSGGGLYSRVNVSVRTVNIVIVIGIAALIFCIIFLSAHGGFTVEFDSNGGSHVESQRLKYGEKIIEPDSPVREGYLFDGWYKDYGMTEKWNMQSDTINESITLYAGWKKK